MSQYTLTLTPSTESNQRMCTPVLTTWISVVQSFLVLKKYSWWCALKFKPYSLCWWLWQAIFHSSNHTPKTSRKTDNTCCQSHSLHATSTGFQIESLSLYFHLGGLHPCLSGLQAEIIILLSHENYSKVLAEHAAQKLQITQES